jgi:hypothetical protein
MTGIVYQAMSMPVRLYRHVYPHSNFSLGSRFAGLGSRSAIPPASLDIARIGRPRRPACLKTMPAAPS